MFRSSETLTALALLWLRLAAAALLVFGHGWPKLSRFTELAARFSDPLHIGHAGSLALVVFAEVLCAIFVALGLLTRLAVIPILIFLAVAVFLQHAHDPWSRKELALIYAVPFVAVLIAGPGRFSLDGLLGHGRGRK